MNELATTEQLQYEITTALADSLPYVLSTWGRAQEQHLPGVTQPGFLRAFARLQARIMRDSAVKCAMQGATIAGFIVYGPNELHWVNVRKELRRHGVGRALILHAFGPNQPTITTWTPDLRHLKLQNAEYTPFWLRITA